MELQEEETGRNPSLVTLLIALGIGGLLLGCCLMSAVVIGYFTLGGEVDFDEPTAPITEPSTD